MSVTNIDQNFPVNGQGDEHSLPMLLRGLSETERVHLRSIGGEYSRSQVQRGLNQENELREAGVNLRSHAYDDPFTRRADREVIDGIFEVMMGIRLQPGNDTLAYTGSRTRGPDNFLTDAFRGLSPAMAYWRDNLVPTSAALAPLYDPTRTHLPDYYSEDGSVRSEGVPIDDIARAVFTESLDGRAIRSRGDTVSRVFLEHFLDIQAYPEGSEINIASLACGAAEVIFSATSELARRRPDLKINVCLADRDQSALDLAQASAAAQADLEGINFTYERVDITSLSALVKLKESAGDQGFDFIDIVGFLEYLPAFSARRFMRNAYDLAAEGGVLCAANMRDTHSQVDLTTNIVRWPYIVPRSLQTLLAMAENACGTVTARDITLTLPDDGAYAVMTIPKTVSR